MWLSLTLSSSGFSCYGNESGEKCRATERNENMSLERPSRLTKNRYTSTSLSLQAKTVYQIRMRLAVGFFFFFVILAIHSSDSASVEKHQKHRTESTRAVRKTGARRRASKSLQPSRQHNSVSSFPCRPPHWHLHSCHAISQSFLICSVFSATSGLMAALFTYKYKC